MSSLVCSADCGLVSMKDGSRSSMQICSLKRYQSPVGNVEGIAEIESFSLKKAWVVIWSRTFRANDSMALHGSFGDEAHEVCFAVVVVIKGLFPYQLNIDADCSPRG
ncbi:hypothetical protein IFM89_009509 [Coptis chinensis]|uniref:Uncharacterized protein n=1 Tax=Coptis chinensis TaxID=261450 RepID=A0A835H2A3_9MAGN|nr:hypothetical protein IFM89_009509 [Coptis chinensis]